MAFWVILIKLAKIILQVQKIANLLKSLSSGSLVRAIVGQFIVSEVVNALAKAGVPVDSYKFLEQARNCIGQIVDAANKDLEKSGIELSLEDLDQALQERVQLVLQGLSVANGKDSQRNPARGADPVLFHRGEFERTSDDMFVRAAGADLILRRVYRSGADFHGSFGRGWDHSLNLRLTEIDAYIVSVLSGDLSETQFVRHPRFGQAGFNYFAPAYGVHDVLEADAAGNFRLRRPRGGLIAFESAGPRVHRAQLIEDAAGNRVDFEYDSDNRLHAVYGNGPHRWLKFFYGARDLVDSVEDHAGRRCLYSYDESGFLTRAEQWGEVAGQPYLTAENYEYTAVGDVRRLARVSDERGRVIVENEYDTRPTSDTFGYLVGQFTEHGPTAFVYEELAHVPSSVLSEADQPVLRIFETPPDGHVIERVCNEAGNELLRREDYVDGGRIRTALLRTRYNEDGAIIAHMDPEGGLTQYMYFREMADIGKWSQFSATLSDVTAAGRMAFGNQLAKVERGRALAELDRVAEQEEWIAALPNVRVRADNADGIIKQVFDPHTQVLLSTSDMRATVSPDPLHVESAPPGSQAFNPSHPLAKAHRDLLTSYEYTPSGLRTKTIYPDRTRPPAIGGPKLGGIAEEITARDARGRPLARRDRRGHITYWEYYPDSALPGDGARAGYPRRELRPHLDWVLDAAFPPLLEVQRNGSWIATPVGLIAAGAAPTAIRLELPCQRIELWRSSDKSETSSCVAAVVSVDGIVHGTWNQIASSDYLISGLGAGPHVVEVAAQTGGLTLGRVVGHVAFTFEVDELGRVVTETDPRGIVTQTVYDSFDRKIERTRGTGPSTIGEKWIYDRDGDLERAEKHWADSAGAPVAGGVVRSTYRRNLRGLVALETTRAPGQADRRVNRYYHDPLGVLVAARNGRGVLTRWRVDSLGRRVRETRAACTDEQSTTTITYDRCGRTLQGRDAEGATRRNGIFSGGSFRSGYDARGRLRFMTDALGHVTVTRHDLGGRDLVVQLFGRRADGTFELVERHELEYDEHGDRIVESTAVISTPVPAADPVNAPDAAFIDGLATGTVTIKKTSYELGADGRRTRIVDGAHVTELAYDSQGRLAEERYANGRRVFRVYDGTGNPLRIYAFDPPAINPASPAAAFLETYRYDEHGRRIQVQDAYGNRWEERYDTLGNVEETVDPLGRRTTLRHNAFGQEIERSEGLTANLLSVPAITTSSYDQCGNLVTVVDALGRRFAYAYDALDRRTVVRNLSYAADPGSMYGYDRCGRVVRETDRNGLVHRHTYDAAGRRIRSDYDASGVAAPNVPSPWSATFIATDYDARGAILRRENDWTDIRQTRDSRGLILEEETALKPSAGAGTRTWRVAQSFDEAGARTGLVFPSGRAVGYIRDTAGRVVEVTNTSTPPDYPGSSLTTGSATLAKYHYAGGRLIDAYFPAASTSLALEYDGRGQPIERLLTDVATSQTLWRQQTLLDAARQTSVESATTAVGDRSRHFAFDALGRLTGYTDSPPTWANPLSLSPPITPVAAATPAAQAAIDALHEVGPSANRFDFDQVGNRLSSQEGGAPALHSTPDADNRYTAVAGKAWSYDSEGRLLNNGIRRFRYDAEGMLAGEGDVVTGAPVVDLIRDALGRIVIARTGVQDSYYAYLDEQTPLTHWYRTGFREYTPGGQDQEPMHVASAGEDHWVVTDALRTPKVVLSSGLAPMQTILDCRPYGAAAPPASPIGLYDFAGMLQYPGSSVLHSGHRSYLPVVGRFMQQDPAGFADGPNRYIYARNNPIDLYDPLGLQTYSPLSKSRLEFIANAKGVGQGKFGVNQERAVGRWFQNTLLQSYGLTENGRKFAAYSRTLATEGGREFVVPDAVSDIRYYRAEPTWSTARRGLQYLAFEVADLGGKTAKDSTFWEFKALKDGEIINLGDSETQIKGMIDAASQTAATQDRRAPLPSSVHLVTTAGVSVSPEVIAYATAKDVELVHHIAEEYTSAEGVSKGLRVGTGLVLNDVVVLRRGAVIVEQNPGRIVYFEPQQVRINLISPRFLPRK